MAGLLRGGVAASPTTPFLITPDLDQSGTELPASPPKEKGDEN
jgi:hypothetical protein